MAVTVLSPAERDKLDRADDSLFYAEPRFVHHLDASFRARLTQLYRERIPACAVVLIPGLPALVQAILAVAIFLFLALVFRALPAELADLLPAGARARFQGRS